jgi:hypothetical protein
MLIIGEVLNRNKANEIYMDNLFVYYLFIIIKSIRDIIDIIIKKAYLF